MPLYTPINLAVPGPIGGTTPAAITGTTISATTSLTVPSGGSVPVITFTGNTTTGLFYNTGDSSFRLHVVGSLHTTFYAGYSVCYRNVYAGTNGSGANPFFSFVNATDSGLFLGASNNYIGIAQGGVERLSVSSSQVTTTVPFKLPSYTVATLPSASTMGAGSLAFVTDGSTTAILGLGLTAVGGGSNKYIVYSDGTNWIVI